MWGAVELENFLEHVYACVLIPCFFQGCTFESSIEDVWDHLLSCSHAPMITCRFCSSEFPRFQEMAHLDHCPELPEICQLCGENIIVDDIMNHLEMECLKSKLDVDDTSLHLVEEDVELRLNPISTRGSQFKNASKKFLGTFINPDMQSKAMMEIANGSFETISHHFQKVQCEYCGSFIQPEWLTDHHQRECENNYVRCEICSQDYLQKEVLIHRYGACPDRELLCAVCSQPQNSRESMAQHLVYDHAREICIVCGKDSVICQSTCRVNCGHCKKNIDPYNVLNHLLYDCIKVECPYCNQTDINLPQIVDHVLSCALDSPRLCEYCQTKELRGSQEYLSHLLKCKENFAVCSRCFSYVAWPNCHSHLHQCLRKEQSIMCSLCNDNKQYSWAEIGRHWLNDCPKYKMPCTQSQCGKNVRPQLYLHHLFHTCEEHKEKCKNLMNVKSNQKREELERFHTLPWYKLQQHENEECDLRMVTCDKCKKNYVKQEKSDHEMNFCKTKCDYCEEGFTLAENHKCGKEPVFVHDVCRDHDFNSVEHQGTQCHNPKKRVIDEQTITKKIRNPDRSRWEKFWGKKKYIDVKQRIPKKELWSCDVCGVKDLCFSDFKEIKCKPRCKKCGSFSLKSNCPRAVCKICQDELNQGRECIKRCLRCPTLDPNKITKECRQLTREEAEKLQLPYKPLSDFI